MDNYSTHDNKNRKKRNKSNNKKNKNRLFVIILRILIALILIVCFAVGGLFIGVFAGIKENSIKISKISVTPTKYTSIVYDKDGNEFDRYKGDENREYVTIDQIPKHLRDAFVAIEDERFYTHSGIDPRGILRAATTKLTGGRREGASTITQQLIKNNVAKITHNTLKTKLEEMYLAVIYEKQLQDQLKSKEKTKNYILEVYLNSVYFNNGLNGVKTAAKYYFNKDVSDLNIAESAVIASIVQRPSDMDPIRHPENNKKRQRAVIKKMLDLGFITKAEYDEAYNDDVYQRVSQYRNTVDKKSHKHNYFSDQVFESVAKDLIDEHIVTTRYEAATMIYSGGLKIYTTMDKNIQNNLEEVYLDNSFFPNNKFSIDLEYRFTIKHPSSDKTENIVEKTTVKKKEDIEPFKESVKQKVLGPSDIIVKGSEDLTAIVQPQSAMVIIDYSNGYVRGLVGGRGEKPNYERSFNRATQSKRQPGSTFKTVAAYAPAIDTGVITPNSIFIDAPININGYAPKNHNNRYDGPITAKEALKLSKNTIAVQVMNKVGPSTSFKYLKQFGFTSLVEKKNINGKIYSDIGLPTALGGLTVGVTQLEMTAAYGTIANKGTYIEPTFYTKVEDHNGKVILKKKQTTRQVLSESSSYLLTDMLLDAVNGSGATGSKAKLKNSSIPVAGKTGTTQRSTDLSFIGFTPYYAAGVWLGYDNPSKKISGVSGAQAKIWSEVMSRIHKDLPNKQFKKPKGVVTVPICAASGKLAIDGVCDHTEDGNKIIMSTFDINHVPKEYCNIHKEIVIDTRTGLEATNDTPEEYRKTIVKTINNSNTIINNTQNNSDENEDSYDDYENENSNEPIIQEEPSNTNDQENNLPIISDDTPIHSERPVHNEENKHNNENIHNSPPVMTEENNNSSNESTNVEQPIIQDSETSTESDPNAPPVIE